MKVSILTDFLSSVKLISNRPKLKEKFLALNINLRNMACQVSIVWNPARQGLPGNELADELAKQGNTREEIFNVGLGIKEGKSLIKNNIFKIWKSEWQNSTTGRRAYLNLKEQLNTSC